jgi:hypothetical protein
MVILRPQLNLVFAGHTIMRMDETQFVENAGALSQVFGEWPSFHDAEVHTMLLDRSGAHGASLEAQVHVFRMTDEVDAQGFYVLTHHSLVGLRFDDISLVQLRWFNTQNALSDLLLEAVDPQANEGGRRYRVRFGSAWGVEAELLCNRIAVTSVEPFAPTT